MNYTEHAIKLQRGNPMVDLHYDLISEIAFRRIYGKETHILKKHYLPIWKAVGFNVIFANIFVEDLYLPGMALKNALDQISVFLDDLSECNEQALIIRNAEDLEEVLKNDKIGIIMSLEGVEPLQGDLKLLNIFHSLGVRAFSLTWNRRNEAGDGCNEIKQGVSGGISNYGVRLIEEAEKRSMIIDGAHLNEAGFWDLIKFSTQPVMVSHSNTRRIYDIPRNLTDKQIKAIGECNGIIGINASKVLLTSAGNESVETLCDHIDVLSEIAGINHIAYGLDLCENYLTHSPFTYDLDIINSITKPDLISHSEITFVTSELLRRGYSDHDVIKIIGGNAIRFLKETL